MAAVPDFQPANPILPPAGRIGILGGGQLGRMSAIAARQMGYHIVTLDPQPDCCAAPVSDRLIQAEYDDPDGLERMGAEVDVITFEFENVAASALERLGSKQPARPGAEVLRVCQNREREKRFFAENGLPHPKVARALATVEGLEAATAITGFPCVAKTSESGYDGKGQVRISEASGVAAAARELGGVPCVVEQWVAFEREISVICARTRRGESTCFPVIENQHRDHILDVSIAPARISPEVARTATAYALRAAEALQLEGMIAVEMFLTATGEVLLNEMAPRPHNSGHYSLDASRTSQFEQHVRSICDLPLGDPSSLCPAVMVNLLGDLWDHGEPPWESVLQIPQAKLHLYGKSPRPKRKVGHVTLLGDSLDETLQSAKALKAALGIPGGIGENSHYG